MWTKQDIMKVIDIWDSKSTDDIAKELKCTKKEVCNIAYQIRKVYPLQRKRNNVTLRLLIEETVSEYQNKKKTSQKRK